MRDLERGMTSISPAGFDGFDASRKRRLDASLRQTARAASAVGWAIGVYDAEQDLVAFDTSEAGIEDRVALALLTRMPFPASTGPIVLNAGAHECDNVPAALGIATDTGKGHSVAMVFVPKDASSEAWAEAAQAIESAASRVAQEISAFDFEGERKRSTPIPGGPHGFFLLDAALDVQFAWCSGEDASAFFRLVRPEDARLPLFLEQAVRRLTSSWNFSRADTCAPRTGYPLHGLSIRVVPMLQNDVYIGVFLDQCEEPDIDAAASTFGISSREREVLHGLLDGRTITEIAADLNVAESTVNDHVSRMVAKTNARNRIQMAATLLGWPSMRPDEEAAPARQSFKDRLTEKSDENDEPRARVSWRYQPGA